MSADLAEPIRDALVASSAITALLATYAGEPAVFTRQPVPGDATYPLIVISPDVDVLDEDGLSDDRPIITRSVIVYSSNQNPTSGRLANQIAFLVYSLLHRQWRALTVADWKVVDIIANGPVILTGADQTIGREIPLTVKLAKARIEVVAVAAASHLLLTDGSDLLLTDGSLLILTDG